LLTADELADFLRVHRSTVYRLLRNGQLPALRVGSDWRFSRDLLCRHSLHIVHPSLSGNRRFGTPQLL